jgi:sarcosine oxidase subunit beta
MEPGGGIVGASILYHLARGGLNNAVLIEKEPLMGMGSSAASAGIIYHHLPEKVNLQLSQKSLRAVLEFENEFGTKIDFRRNGCIMTATTQGDRRELESIHNELARLGVEAHMLRPKALAEFFPDIVTDDLLAAIYTPSDGYFDPYGMIQGYAAAARRLGAKILTRTLAVGLIIKRGSVAGVKTPQGDIETNIVVNASGPSAAGVARLAGLELPIALVKRQIFVTAPTKIISPDSPFYFDKNPPFYLRPESGALLMSIAEMMEGTTHNLAVDWSSAEILAERATRRLPSLSSIQIVRGWAGLRSMTPDHTAILGPVPEPSGFYLAVGFSGHGVMHAPMTGKILASMILTGNLERYEDLDLAPLRCERFLKTG